MKRFRFPEQALLTLRQQEKRVAEAAVMSASRAVAEIEQEIDVFQQWLLRSLNLWSNNTPLARTGGAQMVDDDRAMSPSSTDQNTLLQNAQRQLSISQDRLVAANHRLEQARNELRDAEIAVNTLTTLRKKQSIAHKRLWQSKQQQLADEVTMRMWMSRQRESDTR